MRHGAGMWHSGDDLACDARRPTSHTICLVWLQVRPAVSWLDKTTTVDAGACQWQRSLRKPLKTSRRTWAWGGGRGWLASCVVIACSASVG